MNETTTTAAVNGLSTLGLVTMIVSLGGVLLLAIWCYAKILRAPPPSDE